MTNKEIARKFNDLANIMELHEENVFKIRSYRNAYNTLRKMDASLIDMDHQELSNISGVGKAIADKILELGTTGDLKTYRKYADQTPEGVIEMLKVRGFGPKKVKVIWEEMGIETIGELLYACNENRLIELKGFGEKTQNQLKSQLQYYLDSQGKYLYGYIIDEAEELLTKLKMLFPKDQHVLTGEIRRLCPIVSGIDILTTIDDHTVSDHLEALGLELEDNIIKAGDYPIRFITSSQENFGTMLFKSTGPEEFTKELKNKEFPSEKQVFKALGRSELAPEFRDFPEIGQVSENKILNVVEIKQIKGVIHTHTTYSDGVHSVAEMADHAYSQGYDYLVISDHSKTAVYAGGLTEEQVFQQFEEISAWNEKHPEFRIFKGIEADILADGSMDYGTDFLSNFEVVIASVHSVLKMDMDKATNRLIKAIENPATHILGHPTGRLLLSRKGYPLDHMKVIDACASNGMAIELNANPLRLDLDYTWIPYAAEKGVMIAINPDSHNRESIAYIQFGVNAARKGLLPSSLCLNTLDEKQFEKWLLR